MLANAVPLSPDEMTRALEDPGLAGDVVHGPVDVPLGVAFEVLGQVVVGTLGDHGDLGYRMVRPGDELTEASPEGHLLIIVDPDITEQQHTVVLQRVQEAVRHGGVVQQAIHVHVEHLDTDRAAQLLRRDHISHMTILLDRSVQCQSLIAGTGDLAATNARGSDAESVHLRRCYLGV